MTKTFVIVGIFAAVLIAYIVVVLGFFKTDKKKIIEEHFSNEQPTIVATADDYKARLTVMTVFENHMKRKPTPEEITTFSMYQNEQDILAAILSASSQVPSTNVNVKDIQLEITSMKKNDTAQHILQEEIVLQESQEPFVEEFKSSQEVTISKDYLTELKKNVKRLEEELSAFRNILG